MSERPLGGDHQPTLVRRDDGFWVVHCLQCRTAPDRDTPIGIEVPISNRRDAELIMDNHGSG